ncbi:hypothetical protein [Pseudalkalibacillus hwajinpoensis]|uniref:hypothetical protein n=1 Tax=Guptibacillus hwajinpoensis TaxID=208199 RepID=UPI001CFE37CF|nr:hypothetical protein [Pseudalkalibacillus hwajinpoensis]
MPHFLYYIYDMVFVYFILAFFYLYEQTLPPLFPFLILAIGCGICFFLVYFKKREQLTFAWILPLILLTVMVGILLSVPILYAILLSLTIAWRSYVNIRETNRDDDTLVFFLTLAGSFLFFLFSNSSELRQVVFLLPLVQFLLFLLCRATVEIRKTGGPQQAKWAMSSILLLLAVSSGLFSIMIWMKDPLIKVISYTIGGAGYVIGLPIYWLTSNLPTRSTQNSLLLEGNDQVENQQVNKEQMVNGQSLDLPLELIFYTCLTIALLVLLFILYKKRLTLTRLPVSSFATLTSEMLKASEEKKVRQIKPPSNQIRKQLFDLEKKALKYGVGRHTGETVSEWLRKIPGETDSKNIVRDIYIKERYGEKHPDRQEVLLYKQHMKNLHQELREHALQKWKKNKKK